MGMQASFERSPGAARLASVSPAATHGQKAQERIRGLLEDLHEDLEFIGKLRETFCVEEETGKAEELQETGVRDGYAPRLLPCLQRRYEQDAKSCEACESWWAEICARGELSEPPPPRKQGRSSQSLGRRASSNTRHPRLPRRPN